MKTYEVDYGAYKITQQLDDQHAESLGDRAKPVTKAAPAPANKGGKVPANKSKPKE